MRFCLALLLLLFPLACNRSPARRPPINKVDVVATAYPLAAMAEAVGGPVVDVHWLVESGQTLHDLGDAARQQTQSARLVIFNSSITESAIGADASLALGGERLLRLDQLPESHDATPSGWLWLDPVIVRAAAVELHNRLLALRIGQAAILGDRVDAFTDDLDALMKQYAPRFAPLAGQRVLTIGRDFQPLLARWKFTVETIGDSATDLNDRDIDYLRRIVREQKSVAIVIDQNLSSANRNRIAATGVKLIPLDALGSSATTGHNSYASLIRFDYDTLLDGMKSAATQETR